MCGRFTQTRTWSDLLDIYRITDPPIPEREPQPRFNTAPTQNVAVVRAAGPEGGRSLALLRWGLIPFWAKDPGIGSRLINARAETVAEKPSFRDAFRKRRCLVLADGFYEWQKRPQGAKQPFYITAPDVFAFAGLWERWTDPAGMAMETCTIVTTAATEALRPVHDRMPVMLSPEGFDLWLSPGVAPEAAATLMVPYAGELNVYPVDRRVNAVRNDSPDCIAPAEP